MDASGTWAARLGFGLFLAVASAEAEDTHWTGREYVDLYFRHYSGRAPLPHLREGAQKALFNRLIDPRNIARIAEAPVSQDEKLHELRIILAVLGAYRAAYNVAVIIGEPLEQELTLVQAHSLEVAGTLASLMRKPPDAGGASSAWATLVEGVIASIGDSEHYSPAQSMILAEAVTPHYPAIAAALTREDRRRLRAQALALKPEQGNATQRDALARMKRVLSTAP
jgi:hypothetical protein